MHVAHHCDFAINYHIDRGSGVQPLLVPRVGLGAEWLQRRPGCLLFNCGVARVRLYHAATAIIATAALVAPVTITSAAATLALAVTEQHNDRLDHRVGRELSQRDRVGRVHAHVRALMVEFVLADFVLVMM